MSNTVSKPTASQLRRNIDNEFNRFGLVFNDKNVDYVKKCVDAAISTHVDKRFYVKDFRAELIPRTMGSWTIKSAHFTYAGYLVDINRSVSPSGDLWYKIDLEEV